MASKVGLDAPYEHSDGAHAVKTEGVRWWCSSYTTHGTSLRHAQQYFDNQAITRLIPPKAEHRYKPAGRGYPSVGTHAAKSQTLTPR